MSRTAPIVRQIFDWTLDGHGTAFIKRRLEENKVPCPTWWNRQRGIRNHYTKWELQAPENGKYVWDDTVIGDMLINPFYYGAIASQKKNYKFIVGVINEKKPDEWIIVENMHDPIVDQSDFEIDQEKIESRKCSRGVGTTSLFAGLIKCGECGKALTIRKTIPRIHKTFMLASPTTDTERTIVLSTESSLIPFTTLSLMKSRN